MKIIINEEKKDMCLDKDSMYLIEMNGEKSLLIIGDSDAIRIKEDGYIISLSIEKRITAIDNGEIKIIRKIEEPIEIIF